MLATVDCNLAGYCQRDVDVSLLLLALSSCVAASALGLARFTADLGSTDWVIVRPLAQLFRFYRNLCCVAMRPCGGRSRRELASCR